jgi:hypothetical protein
MNIAKLTFCLVTTESQKDAQSLTAREEQTWDANLGLLSSEGNYLAMSATLCDDLRKERLLARAGRKHPKMDEQVNAEGIRGGEIQGRT